MAVRGQEAKREYWDMPRCPEGQDGDFMALNRTASQSVLGTGRRGRGAPDSARRTDWRQNCFRWRLLFSMEPVAGLAGQTGDGQCDGNPATVPEDSCRTVLAALYLEC